MRMNNKMRDFEVEYEEWWEVVKEYFTKELEKILVQHKANVFFLKYKLEVYQTNFLHFVYGSPTSTKASDKAEEAKIGPNGII